MIHSRKFLTAALAGLGMVIAATAVAPFADAQASGVAGDMAVSRISAAFAVAPAPVADPALVNAARRSGKGDLFAGGACGDQKWPEIATGCLTTGKGNATRSVRYVTIGYQTGIDGAVLVRMPAPQIAFR